MSDDDMINDNDEDISKNHSQLLKSVAELDHTFLKIKKSERNELTSEISEFHLVRSGITDNEPVRLENLVNTLRGQDQSLKLSNQFKATKKRAKILPKPLEKPVDERLKRQVCFENTSENLKKWNPIVTKNRVADHLVFPINTSSSKKFSDNRKVKSYRIQSDLEKEYASLEPSEEAEDNENQIDKFTLTKEEMIQKAKENAKFRAQQSYKAEKARRVNKIKSKKFHKIEKKAKIKQQFQEFDKLQKSNPELALQKLEELDKARALERMSLKHKNTGQWARNKQVRAKYDKESRQVLAQQLSISRELTQKVKKDDSDDDDYEDLEPNASKTTSEPLEYNPWVNNEIFSLEPEINSKEHQIDIQNENKISNNNLLNPVEQVSVEYVNDKNKKPIKGLDKKRKIEELKYLEENKVKKMKNIKDKSMKKNATKQIINSGTSEWLVEESKEVSQSFSLSSKKLPTVSEIFETLENDNQRKALKKLKKLKRKLKTQNSIKNNKLVANSNNEESDLSFKTKSNRPFIDDALDENVIRHDNDINKTGQVTEHQSRLDISKNISKATTTEIDPNKFIQAKSKHINLKNDLPDDLKNEIDVLDDSDEDESEENQQKIISEAFIDDDVTNEFKNEKEEQIKNSQLRQVETRLPGWGSWADKNFKTSQRKKRRIIINSNETANRKDKNKENVIIIDDVDAKLRQHQINDLPHPFVTVEDFEASIRTPIGRNFVPEISHRQLTKPPVKTRMGTIIEPMSEDVLMKEKSPSKPLKRKNFLNEIKL
ncbi:U3 small nucleolar RNA-associated protein 14 homolog A [Cotesia typhae]|uniref:U3 small nucleolar RNA-associated protein 14 homolog A n=1 Tax=Cotesia typhae TaxID=2053667 RepID=UPI003D688021